MAILAPLHLLLALTTWWAACLKRKAASKGREFLVFLGVVAGVLGAGVALDVTTILLNWKHKKARFLPESFPESLAGA